ncbi:Histidine kinase- DNA gyrase B- and HSP90-like ATPase [Aspergillus parasiticus SU-1]|uniref:Histidine kinase-DNA gyrase B-and HSP90-like ATPase n=1 Tax=Aspergillus parasiticus (strain ATCC 56775 / NRRL 5862 / SRRC 143 / SU-1) TaxID=1403190 RepID=A0A0F0I2P2_ASPPU|nr:Histidine kinase- DNA gyrase B- and HSP90-like ATPase [Aspergillus parasiticus SU-1]
MPITALPPSTVRAIGSTSVISDPCSVVKELLDNALDASATSIGIEISSNAVDVIQVKDNGHGIPSDDHALVCKRTFTSKIQTVEDLRNLGGKSLGFRGEALASAAEVSGGVTITTRVEAEMVGTSIKYGRNGELISSQRASHPVGTTVRINDLFKHIPVRRQSSLKSAVKTLTRIKKLIQLYAMAQPSKRLSLKVLKARNENNNWIYAPGRDATVTDAALKIAGTDVTCSCVLKEWPSEDDINSEQPQEEHTSEFGLLALLLDLDTDCTKLSNTGQFLAIDGRPISSSRGIGQDISKLYKLYLRSALSRSESSPSITDPFLCLHIQCPQGSYDVNIEPAKDDVLFEDSQRLLSLLEDLFRSMYGEREPHLKKRPNSTKGKGAVSDNDAFDLLLARKSPSENSSSVDTNSGSCTPHFVTARSLAQSADPSPALHVVNGQFSASSQINKASGTESRRGSTDQGSLNPWSITRCNTPFRKSSENHARTTTVHRLPMDDHVHVSKERRRGSQETARRYSAGSFLPSPTSSTLSASSSPSDSRSFPATQASPTSRGCDETTRASRKRAKEKYGNGALDTWFGKTTQVALAQLATEEPSDDNRQEPSLSQLAHERFRSQEQSSPESCETTSRTMPVRRGSATSTPESSAFSSTQPQNSISRVAPQGPASEVRERRQEFPVLEQWSSRLHSLAKDGPKSDLETALDFEHRKKEAIQRRREIIKGRPKPPASTNSPHLSRYLAARAALRPEFNESTHNLNTLTSPEVMTNQILNPHDPRSYLIRHQDASRQGEAPKDNKIRRINTNKLPFEKVPEGHELHDIGINLSATLPVLATLSKEVFKSDLYTQCGEQFEAFSACDLQSDLVELWTSRLSSLLKSKYKAKEGYGEPTPRFDFSALAETNSSHN